MLVYGGMGAGNEGGRYCETLALHLGDNVAQPGSISGTKFFDQNANGTWDTGEPGLEGWTIDLKGPVSASATTDGSGHFSFPNLPLGQYRVCEDQAFAEWTATVPTAGCYFTVPLGDG